MMTAVCSIGFSQKLTGQHHSQTDVLVNGEYSWRCSCLKALWLMLLGKMTGTKYGQEEYNCKRPHCVSGRGSAALMCLAPVMDQRSS